MKSEPRAATTQDAVVGNREKAMRIESVEQFELGSIMELSVTDEVLRWARQSNLSGAASLRKADGWNMKNHSHLTVVRHLREKIHPSVLVVTIRESEERGMCNAALRELLSIVKDQIGETCAVAMVLSRESTIWRRASVETLLTEKETAEIFRRRGSERGDMVKSVAMNGVNSGKFGGKLETVKMTKRRGVKARRDCANQS